MPRNPGACDGMERSGVTVLINSVTKLNFINFPNGSVLDIMLHPSAVIGEEGLNAFTGLIKSCFTICRLLFVKGSTS